jgi:hypothetical protein
MSVYRYRSECVGKTRDKEETQPCRWRHCVALRRAGVLYRQSCSGVSANITTLERNAVGGMTDLGCTTRFSLAWPNQQRAQHEVEAF